MCARSLAIEIVEPSVRMVTPSEWLPQMSQIIEYCGRLCHKTEDRVTGDAFIGKVARKLRHESIEEHNAITFHFIGSRTFSHQLIRHRLCAFSQESQRYCDYSHEKYGSCLKVICPPTVALAPPAPGTLVVAQLEENEDCNYTLQYPDGRCDSARAPGERFWVWTKAVLRCYGHYLWLRDNGVPAEDARFVLPNSAKTEIAMTANVRQWRHVIEMRCDKHAQWEVRGLMLSVLRTLNTYMPASFGDLADRFLHEAKEA